MVGSDGSPQPAAKLWLPPTTYLLPATSDHLALPAAEEMRVDEFVDSGLILRLDLLELQSHAVAAIAPRDAAFGVDVALGTGQAVSKPHLRAILERAGGANRDAAAADVQRERSGDGVAESIRDGNAEHDARAAAAIEVVGKQVWRERRQNVLHRTVFVDVAGDAQRRQFAYFFGAGDRAAENENGQPPIVEPPDASHELDARGVRQPEVDDEEIDLRLIGAHAREQLGRALDGDGAMAGAFERGLETVADERSVVGNQDGLCARGASGHESVEVPRDVSESDVKSVSARCRI